MERLLNLWWTPVALALMGVIAWETDWGDGFYRPVVVAAAPEARPLAPALLPEYKAAAGLEAFDEVIDRPLFSPTRRQAPPPPPPEPPKQVMQTGQFLLTGTIKVGDKLYAFLKEAKGGKGVRASEGDTLPGGIKLLKVEADKVVLTQYDSEEEVKLLVSKSTRMTPVPPAPGAPGAVGGPGASVPPGMAAPPAPSSLRPNVEPGRPTPAPGQPSGPPFVPGVTTLAPFVPGVSSAAPVPNKNGNEVPPRRRGAMQ
jgi:hypothetical protein